MFFIARLVLNTVALMLVAQLVQGVEISSYLTAFIAALILGLVNAVVRPICIILTLPINILSLGLFTLVINALMLWLVSTLTSGFEIASFWPAFWAALIYWLITWFTTALIDKPHKD